MIPPPGDGRRTGGNSDRNARDAAICNVIVVTARLCRRPRNVTQAPLPPAETEGIFAEDDRFRLYQVWTFTPRRW